MTQLKMHNALVLNDKLDEAKMDNSIPKKPRSFHQPLSVFSKTSIVVLLVHTAFLIGLALFVKQPLVLIVAGVELLIAALITTGIRWTPLLGSIVGALFLFALANAAGYPIHHLTHPKDAFGFGVIPVLSFIMFTVMLTLFWSPAMLVVAGIAAVIQNYFQRERRTPRWFKTALTGALCILFGALILGALQQPDPVAAASSNGQPTVHLLAGSFSQSSITISKGSKLTLVDDGAYHHNISDGSWTNGQPTFNNQAGEPLVKNQDINAAGTSIVIGPFTTAGTYHLFCSIHSGMTLTIIVQ
ncbi:MAG TPA: plastocyanin/azurin family copper-binding protein [Ktedonobacteraceae bacterium]|nr:plastocyanin/azurin family copper-binding protein [Ktedonobacteraceae bacterium]HEV2661271.1 plastocyanin/azurin family copper-binding protein [Ktedonobacteraceae bacterium]